MADADAKFLTGNLFRHVTVMSLTTSLGLVAVFFVDFLDMLFISMLGQAELAAAIGYAGAILFFTTSFGIGMGIAAGALVARSLGEGDRGMARRRASTALFYGFFFGALFAALVWFNVDWLVALLGAEGDTAALAVGYLQIVVPSLPVLMIGISGGAILRAHGAARAAMMATIWGSVVNGILDPLLIFGLGLDLTGAALATVIARFAIAYTALRPVIREFGALVIPTPRCFAVDLPPILTIAVPAILTQLATPVGQAYVTRAMASHGEAAVAGLAMISRLTPVAFGVIFALSGAIGPIVGQNFGAGLHDRVRRALIDGLIFTALYVVATTGFLYAFREQIADLFGASGDARTLVLLFCGPLALAFYFNGMLFVSNSAFNNLGHPFYSTWLNWGRHTLGTIPFVMAGGALIGAPGVLIGQAIGGSIFGGLAVYLAFRTVKSPGKAIISSPFGRQARLMQILHLRR